MLVQGETRIGVNPGVLNNFFLQEYYILQILFNYSFYFICTLFFYKDLISIMFSSGNSCNKKSEISLQSTKDVLTSKSLQSLNMGEPLIYEDIDDSIKDSLSEFSFTKMHLFKSRLNGSISEKIIQDVVKCRYLNIGKDLFIAFRSAQLIGYLLSITIEQALIHHLEIILQGKKNNKNALILLSYGADGLQHLFKYYNNQDDRKQKFQKMYKHRKNNFYQKIYELKQSIHGERVLEFMKDFFKNGQQTRYNLIKKNCHTFIQSFLTKIIGYNDEILNRQQELNKTQKFMKYLNEIKKFFKIALLVEDGNKPAQNAI